MIGGTRIMLALIGHLTHSGYYGHQDSFGKRPGPFPSESFWGRLVSKCFLEWTGAAQDFIAAQEYAQFKPESKENSRFLRF